MGIPWRRIFSGVKTGLSVAAQFDPRIAMIDHAIEGIEQAVPDKPGADKKATVEAISDAVIETDLAHMTPDQQDQFKALRSEYIDLTVREKNIVAEVAASRDALTAFLHSFGKPQTDAPPT